jgi:hypothetical protein
MRLTCARCKHEDWRVFVLCECLVERSDTTTLSKAMAPVLLSEQ